MLTGAALAAATLAVGAAASQAGTKAPPPETVELVWGGGEAPRYVARAAAPTAPSGKQTGGVELRWGYGGPPEYVTVAAS